MNTLFTLIGYSGHCITTLHVELMKAGPNYTHIKRTVVKDHTTETSEVLKCVTSEVLYGKSTESLGDAQGQ